MTDTAQTIINSSFKLLGKLGAGESPDADDSTDALQALQDMLDAWSTEPLMIYVVREVSHTLTANDGQYSIAATGADIAAARPIRIRDGAFIRDADSGDHALRVTHERAEYAAIYKKTAAANRPTLLFYDPSFPSGTIYLWPVPTAAETLKFHAETTFSTYALGDTFTLPPGYRRCVVHNLALELAPLFRVTVPDDVRRIADESRAWLKTVNAPRPGLKNDAAGIGRGDSGGTTYDINRGY